MANQNEKTESKPLLETLDADGTPISDPFAKVWQLTVEAWAKKGIDITKQRMRRDVTRVIRRKRHG